MHEIAIGSEVDVRYTICLRVWERESLNLLLSIVYRRIPVFRFLLFRTQIQLCICFALALRIVNLDRRMLWYLCWNVVKITYKCTADEL